ncbi:MAG: ABC transporter substrate-binding protein [Bacilli bacterium]
MKKYRLFLLFITLLTVLVTSGCSSQNKLLILNWGEYISEEVVEMFEQEYDVRVSISLADSNELFYSKIKAGTTAYDLVVPSDYMVEKMYEKNLLQKIDYSKLTNYDKVLNPFMPGVIDIQSKMFTDSSNYAVPYFWGTFGLMYNKNKQGLKEAVTSKGWEAYFNPENLPSGTKVGMYDVPRFAYAAALLASDMSPNLETSESLNVAKSMLSRVKFAEWGTDTLKKGVANGNLDLAFVYTGDFLDMLYVKLDDGNTIEDINFDIYIPDQTIAFMDALVIPKKARNVEMAHAFINFMLRPEIAYMNASVIGYATPLLNSYNQIVNYQGNDEWLSSWAYATKKYYPILDVAKGMPIANLERDFLTKINNMVNNVKVNN